MCQPPHRHPHGPLLRASCGILGVLVALVAAPAQATQPGLDVEISGIRSDRGVVYIAVFADAESYEQTSDPVASVAVQAAEGTVTAHIDLPEKGKVAISVFHDENSNGSLDTNRLGIPLEGYGFSNGVVGRFGKPGFSKITIEVRVGTVVAEIGLHYLM